MRGRVHFHSKIKDITKELTGNLKIRRKAEELAENPKLLKKFLKLVKKVLESAGDIPLFGRYFEDLATMIDLLEDYAAGRYLDIPHRFLVSIIIALIYMANPIDILPDFIPIIGQLDDIAVIQAILLFGLDAELIKYRKWKVKQTAIKSDIIDVEPEDIIYEDVTVSVENDDVEEAETDSH